MWKSKTVALVLPANSEVKSAREAILDFDSSGYVDEIIVVNNGLLKESDDEITGTRARIVKEKHPGYGAAVRAGIKATDADLIIAADANGSFAGRDVTKLLAYSDDFDIVFGSRTHVPLIESGSGMNFFRRIIDVLYGKLISLLFLCGPLTDVGCTFRITSRAGWRKVASECQAKGALFTTEWLLAAAKNRVRFVQIPVNFKSRADKSIWPVRFLNQSMRAILIFFCIWKVWIYARAGKKLY